MWGARRLVLAARQSGFKLPRRRGSAPAHGAIRKTNGPENEHSDRVRYLGTRAPHRGELDRVCGRKPADPYPDKDYVVRRCLTVVCKEEAEHHRYAVRDLTVLEADARTE